MAAFFVSDVSSEVCLSFCSLESVFLLRASYLLLTDCVPEQVCFLFMLGVEDEQAHSLNYIEHY